MNKAIKAATHEDLELIKEIHTLVSVVAHDPSLTVKLDPEGETTNIDYGRKEITISLKTIPKAYRAYPELVHPLLQALAQHEAQHWVFTMPVFETYKAWMEHKGNRELAGLVRNWVEDYRVNEWLREAYVWDIGRRMDMLIETFRDSWKADLKRQAKRWDDEERRSAINYYFNGVVTSGIYGVPLDEWTWWYAKLVGYVPAPVSVSALKQMIGIVHESKYAIDADALGYAEELYQLVYSCLRDKWDPAPQGGAKGGSGGAPVPSTISSRPADVDPDLRGSLEGRVPIFAGGTVEVGGDAGKAKKAAEAEKTSAEEAAGEGEKGPKYSLGGASVAGKGSGAEVPFPEPDPAHYSFLVARNMPHITRLLNLLKRTLQPKIQSLKFQKSGRLMTKHLARYAVQRRPVEYIYQRKKYVYEKQGVALCLVVDLSGSMDTAEAQDVLTTIAEVGGRWLKDEDLAVFVFGSTFQKIKAFGESFSRTKTRIGGTRNLNGTVPLPCLDAVHRMFEAYGNGRRRICVLVSDFYVEDPEGVKKKLKEMRKSHIETVGVGLCHSNIGMARKFTGPNSTYVSDVYELPDKLFQIYREVVK